MPDRAQADVTSRRWICWIALCRDCLPGAVINLHTPVSRRTPTGPVAAWSLHSTLMSR